MLTTALFLVESVLLWSSVVGALLVLITYTCLQGLLTQPTRLIVCMSACIAIGYSAMWFAFRPLLTTGWLCTTLAVILHYFLLANVCWSLAISMNFYQVIVRRNRDVHLLDLWYHLLCWGVPAVFCGTVMGLGGYGSIPGSDACYITTDLLRFACFIAPSLLVICCNAILFFFIGVEIHMTLSQASGIERSGRREELRVYFTVFVSVGLTWCSLFALYLVPEQPVVIAVLRVLVALTVPSQGVLLFIAYCLKGRVLRRWAGVVGRCIPCCSRWAEGDGITAASTVAVSSASPRGYGSSPRGYGSSGGSGITTPYLRTAQYVSPRNTLPSIPHTMPPTLSIPPTPQPPSLQPPSLPVPAASPPVSPVVSPRAVYESTRDEDGSFRV
jgi:hypothetical protein